MLCFRYFSAKKKQMKKNNLLEICWKKYTKTWKKTICVRGSLPENTPSPQGRGGGLPPVPGCFWIETQSQLVLGRCWLTFLNLARENLSQIVKLNMKNLLRRKDHEIALDVSQVRICTYTPSPSPLLHLRSGPIFMEDAHIAESNEKSIFRFLFFELWSTLYSKFVTND